MSTRLNDEVIRMLKNGVPTEAIQQRIQEEGNKSYSYVFIDFMQDMLRKYKKKRTEIADVTGISRDYLYKVLNGQKKTTERDYVIAVCIAIGMNLPETQHALETNGMPLLDGRDLREHILISCISEGRKLYKTNDWLDNAGFPVLRVSKEMEQYVSNIDYSAEKPEVTKRKFTKLEEETFAEHCGNAPFDYTYWANMTVTDEDNNKYYLQGYYAPDFTAFSVIDEENHQKFMKHKADNGINESIDELDDVSFDYEKFESMSEEEQQKYLETIPTNDSEIIPVEDEWETLESYDSLDDAMESDFARYFMEIDHLTDEKVRETLSKVNDTETYGMRFGLKWAENGFVKYAEQYDAQDPAKHQYFQVVESDDGVTYSASHESVFMRIEMGSIYSTIFGEYKEPKYFIHITDEKDFKNISIREHFILQTLRSNLHMYLKGALGNMSDIDDCDLDNESIEANAKHAAWEFMNRDYKSSLETNLQVLEMAEKHEQNYNDDKTATIVTTLSKIATCYECLEDFDNSLLYREKILAYKDRLYKVIENRDEDCDGAVQSYSYVLLLAVQNAQNDYDFEKVSEDCMKIIDLLERRDDFFGAEDTLFNAYIKNAFALDEMDRSEDAIEYYEKAELLVRRYHLENGRYRRNVMSFYNNYAWVLWNRFENEEAIIYYGKAIELAEDSINESEEPDETLNQNLEHYADGLLTLYKQTGKDKEADRLKRRMRAYNIILD